MFIAIGSSIHWPCSELEPGPNAHQTPFPGRKPEHR